MSTQLISCLNCCRPEQDHHSRTLMPVTTPLVVEAWEQALSSHPDRAFARYICLGLRQGFRIGFCHQNGIRSASSNMGSASLHSRVVGDYLRKELSLGRMLGPFPDSSTLPPLQVNRFGVIPKGHNTGKWRLITDLSFLPGRSVIDGIDPSLCSLSYISVDQVANVAAGFGGGALLAKVDIESAYIDYSRFILRTAPSRQCDGKGSYILTQCCHSVCGPHQRYLMRLRTLLIGTCDSEVCSRYSTTWMTL